MQNPRNIKELDAGYHYLIPCYTVTDDGLEDGGDANILFCRGDKSDDSKPRQNGFFVETLIETCRQRLMAVNVGELASRETTEAITKLEEAIMWLEKRSNDRKIRAVEGTYQK
jgi:hypothetical protein